MKDLGCFVNYHYPSHHSQHYKGRWFSQKEKRLEGQANMQEKRGYEKDAIGEWGQDRRKGAKSGKERYLNNDNIREGEVKKIP